LFGRNRNSRHLPSFGKARETAKALDRRELEVEVPPDFFTGQPQIHLPVVRSERQALAA